MKHFGADGARIANYMVKRNKNVWHRSDRKGFKRRVAFAANALRNRDLSPELGAGFEVVVLVGGVFDAHFALFIIARIALTVLTG